MPQLTIRRADKLGSPQLHLLLTGSEQNETPLGLLMCAEDPTFSIGESCQNSFSGGLFSGWRSKVVMQSVDAAGKDC